MITIQKKHSSKSLTEGKMRVNILEVYWKEMTKLTSYKIHQQKVEVPIQLTHRTERFAMTVLYRNSLLYHIYQYVLMQPRKVKSKIPLSYCGFKKIKSISLMHHISLSWMTEKNLRRAGLSNTQFKQWLSLVRLATLQQTIFYFILSKGYAKKHRHHYMV